MSEPTFADIAVALKILAIDLAERAENAEVLAARIGLPLVVAEGIVAERRLQAEMIGRAHTIIKELIPVEPAVTRIIADLQRSELRPATGAGLKLINGGR